MTAAEYGIESLSIELDGCLFPGSRKLKTWEKCTTQKNVQSSMAMTRIQAAFISVPSSVSCSWARFVSEFVEEKELMFGKEGLEVRCRRWAARTARRVYFDHRTWTGRFLWNFASRAFTRQRILWCPLTMHFFPTFAVNFLDILASCHLHLRLLFSSQYPCRLLIFKACFNVNLLFASFFEGKKDVLLARVAGCRCHFSRPLFRVRELFWSRRWFEFRSHTRLYLSKRWVK